MIIYGLMFIAYLAGYALSGAFKSASLPQSDIIEAEGELYVADRLSDKYGFCIVAIERNSIDSDHIFNVC